LFISHYIILVRRPTLTSNASPTSCPGIGRRIGDYSNIKPLVPIRYTTTNNNNSNSSSGTTIVNQLKSKLPSKIDIDIQKENKFKQIFEQSNVDLSINDN
jgi:hypothetical protein